MFESTLIEVQTERPLDQYREAKVPILDQGTEGACTGFGLATVVHYLLRTRDVIRDDAEVSPRMLYDMARRYDEWPGEKYSGSSARGAMKGWHKHGVCSRRYWVYDRKLEDQDDKLFTKRYEEALRRPLGAYFRVNHKDLVAMHAAMTEVGILYATAQVHEGWQNVGTRRCHQLGTGSADHRRPCLCHGCLRPPRILDPELMGGRLGQGWIRANLVRRLARQRQRHLGCASGCTGHPARA